MIIIFYRLFCMFIVIFFFGGVNYSVHFFVVCSSCNSRLIISECKEQMSVGSEQNHLSITRPKASLENETTLRIKFRF